MLRELTQEDVASLMRRLDDDRGFLGENAGYQNLKPSDIQALIEGDEFKEAWKALASRGQAAPIKKFLNRLIAVLQNLAM